MSKRSIYSQMFSNEVLAICQVNQPLSPKKVIDITNQLRTRVGRADLSLRIRDDNLFLDVRINNPKEWNDEIEDFIGLILGALTEGSVAITGPEEKKEECAAIYIMQDDLGVSMTFAKQAFTMAHIPIQNIPNQNDRLFMVTKKDLRDAEDALKTRRIAYEIVKE